jgi:hypothetical protein
VCPENDELFEQLTYFIMKYSQVAKIIVMGDFNSRTGIHYLWTGYLTVTYCKSF